MSEENDVPCLVRQDVTWKSVSAEEKRYYPATIYLHKKKITVGRSVEVDCCILSHTVSRLHAVIEEMDSGFWAITDCKSTNGISVDGQPLNPGIPHMLTSGAIVQFGRDKEQASCLYVFRPPRFPSGVSSGSSSSIGLDDSPRPKRMRLMGAAAAAEFGGEPSICPEMLCRKKAEIDVQLQLERELQTLRREKAEWMQNQAKLEKRLDDARESLAAHNNERMRLESELQQATKSRLECEDAMRREKARQESSYLMKEVECQKLQDMLDAKIALECVAEAGGGAPLPSSQTQKSETLIMVISNMLEVELQCSICSELFHKATTLQCSHTFCSQCISEWHRKKGDCPICRQAVTAFVPTIVIDEFLDKAVDVLSPELKQRRMEVQKERASSGTSAPVGSTSVDEQNVPGPSRRAGHERTHSRRSSRWTTAAESVIELSSQSDSSVSSTNGSSYYSDTSEQDVEIPGVGGSYYGGYGQCFVCGQRGHWARGCPYR